jgi:hypothetical protein
MVAIAADNPLVAGCLQKSVTLATEAGTVLSDALVIKCVDGGLSVEAAPERTGETLIRLPSSCHVPAELFELAVSGGNIVMSAHEPELASECVAQMEMLLELYNLTGKLDHHRRTSPWSLLAIHSELLAQIGQRLPDDLSAMSDRFTSSGDGEELMLASFLHTRTFDFRETENAPPFPLLLPIIDFMNHHLQGSPVQFEGQPDREFSAIVKRSAPVPGGGNECFVFYGLYDAFDTWMSYGFIDENASFVRSIPMTVELPRFGTLRIANFIGFRRPEDLPAEMRDIHFLIPKFLARRPRQLGVTSMLIPAPPMWETFQRILGYLINEISPGHPQQRDLALLAEQQILAANEAYYANLAARLRSLTLREAPQRPILDNFLHMSELQLAHIRKCSDYARERTP